MLFNSLEFALFLPIVLLLYWFVFNRNLKLQNSFIVVASYVFYGWWDWRFLLLIAFTSICSWSSGILISRYRNSKKLTTTKIVAIINIVLNLCILGYFKYYNFFISSFVEAFASCGINLQMTTLRVILPVGISFYTFQALSYTIDVYRNKISPTKDVIAFLAFVSFFPQLVAGPIERATNLLPQILKKRVFDYNTSVDGMRQILWGLFKKIVVADNCALYVNQIWENYPNESGSTLLLGAIFFTFQIYGDFSGYSDIAIGVSRLFGINLMRNFNYPYFSRDIAEFWRRWHISLSTWFRDYLYIPLGGSRVGVTKAIRNTFIIFLVSGFWHGANWTFIAWGGYHAILFLPLMLLGKNRKYLGPVADGKILPNLRESGQMLLTFTLVVIGWILFRANTISEAYYYFKAMILNNFFTFPSLYTGTKKTLLAIFILLIVEWINRNNQFGLQLKFKNRHILKWSIYYVIIILIMEFGAKSQSFIYFQF